MRCVRFFALAAVLLALVAPAAAEQAEVLPPIGPPSSYAVGEKPQPVERSYERRMPRVWKEVVRAVQEAGIEIEIADEASGYLKTKLMSFDGKRFRDVATPPPPLTRERPIRQWVHLNRGQFSVEIAVRKGPEGTIVAVQPYVEEAAGEITTGRKLWVERYSNGTIERYFLDLFDKGLK